VNRVACRPSFVQPCRATRHHPAQLPPTLLFLRLILPLAHDNPVPLSTIPIPLHIFQIFTHLNRIREANGQTRKPGLPMMAFGGHDLSSECAHRCHRYTTPTALSTKGAGLPRAVPLLQRQPMLWHCIHIRPLHGHQSLAIRTFQYAHPIQSGPNILRSLGWAAAIAVATCLIR